MIIKPQDLKYFCVEEFVYEDLYTRLGDYSLSLVNWRIILTVMQLREFFGLPIYLNTWKWEGKHQYRGLRPMHIYEDPRTGTKFDRRSCHLFGLALDFSIKGMPSDEVRKALIKHRYLFPHIHRMEHDTNGWTHIDCKGEFKPEIVMFNAI